MNSSSDVLSKLFNNGEYSELNTLVNNAEVICANGDIGSVNAYAFYIDNAAFNIKNCKKIIKTYELAAKTGSPVIGFYSSPGVKLNEGFEALNEYGEMLNKAFSVSGVVPQIAVVCGECLGVAAVMSNTADVVIGVKGADYYLVSGGEYKTENSAEKGVADIICEDVFSATECVKAILPLLPRNNLSLTETYEYADGESIEDEGSFVEFKAEYEPLLKTGLATLGGLPVGIIDFKSNAITIKGAYKAEQIIKLCNAYNLPVITVADSSGFAEEENSALLTALTKLSSAYANSTTVKISVITKSCIGGAYVLLAGKGAAADLTVAVNGAVISPMSVPSAVAFMLSDELAKGEDRTALEKKYAENNLSAVKAAEAGAVDSVVEMSELRKTLITSLKMLSSKRETTIPRKHTVK